MSNKNKTIDEILDLEAVEVITENTISGNSTSLVVFDMNENSLTEVKSDNSTEDEDSEFVRKNLKQLLETGTKSLKRLSNFAENDMSPRAFEVIATLVKTLSDTSMQLMTVHKSKAETKRLKQGKSADPDKDKSAQNTTTTTNLQQNINVDQAVFVGSSTDLLKQIKDKKLATNQLLEHDPVSIDSSQDSDKNNV